MAISPDGALLAAACEDSSIPVWSTDDWVLRHQFEIANGAAQAVAFALDGQFLVAGGESYTLPVWDLSTGKEVSPRMSALPSRAWQPIRRFGLSPDGRFLAAGSGYLGLSDIFLFDLKAMLALRSVRDYEGNETSCVTFSPDGRFLAAGYTDGTMALFNMHIGSARKFPISAELACYLPGHDHAVRATAWSGDRGFVAESHPDFTVRVLDTRTRQQRVALRGHTGPVSSVDLSFDGGMAVTGSFDRTVRVWDVATGQETRTLTGHSHHVRCVALSPDGRTLASGDGPLQNGDGVVKLWDTSKGEERGTLKPQARTVRALAFSPDGQTLACGTGSFFGSLPAALSLYEVTTGRELGVLGKTPPRYIWPSHPEGHSGDLLALAFSPDGKLLASGSKPDATILLWDVTGRALHGRLPGHRGGVLALAFSPGGHALASSGRDGVVRLWDLACRGSRGFLPAANVIRLSFSPDGKNLASASSQGTTDVCRSVAPELLSSYEQSVHAQSSTADATLADRQLVPVLLRMAQLQEKSGDAAAARRTRDRAEELQRQLSPPAQEPRE